MQTSMGSVTGRIWGSNSLMAMHGFGSSLRQVTFASSAIYPQERTSDMDQIEDN